MTTSFTFVNATAARLFADEWYKRNFDVVNVDGSDTTVHYEPKTLNSARFLRAASWFNAASQSAREIAGEGDDEN